MHSIQIKLRLEKLDPSVLAEALIELSDRDKNADALIKRLISTPAESVALFKRKLSGIKRRRKFVFRAGSRALSSELEELIKLINEDATPPEAALKCLVSFFESDHKIMNMCDDSNGDVSGVFRYEATQCFIKKAQQLDEPATLLLMTQRLMKENDYGVRDSLFENTAEYLDEPALRKLYKHLEKHIEELKQSEPEKEHSYGKVSSAKFRLETIAKQLNDPELFESLCRDDDSKVPDYKMLQVAQVYLDAGHPETALKRLNTIDIVNFNFIYEHKKLLLEIHEKMGNADEVNALQIKTFLESPSKSTYRSICETMDECEVQKILDQCLIEVESNSNLHSSTVNFLLDLKQYDRASQYLTQRHDQIDGYNYYTYPEIAKTFKTEGFPLAASLIYRALLLSLLERAQTKSYPHGAGYLKSLNELATEITDWKKQQTHGEFHQSIQENHARKASFWKHVNKNS